VIVTLGLFLALNSLAQLIFGTDPQVMPSPFPSGAIDLFSADGGTVDVGKDTLGLMLVLLGESALLWLLLQRTRVGLMLRAVAANPESSRLHGIRAGTMLMLGWGLSAGLGAVAGALVAAGSRSGFSASTMQGILVFAFAAAALGGFDSLIGAVVSGLVVGVARSLTIQYVGFLDGIEPVLPLTLILVVLLVRPNGLFGRRTVERV
jgi:branched-chain amino acid transport system permease protein